MEMSKIEVGSIQNTTYSGWFFEHEFIPLNRTEKFLKRLLDLFVAITALLILAPLLLLVAAAVKITIGSPVLFIQDRGGLSGNVFKIVKFRSMRSLEYGPEITQVTKNDPRISRVGSFIRRTSIDELPQLWNVITGDMSIVGPRPHALAHDIHFSKVIPRYALRHYAKPGITGLAQIRGYRGETSELEDMIKRVEADLEYLKNWSLWGDILIIFKTTIALFKQTNAL